MHKSVDHGRDYIVGEGLSPSATCPDLLEIDAIQGTERPRGARGAGYRRELRRALE